jgi:hypothetical protein
VVERPPRPGVRGACAVPNVRELIGRYHGRLIAAAESWSDRLGNLYYKGEREGWLNRQERGYYFATTCYRFLMVCSLTRAFEREAIFMDARYAESSDLTFLNFTRAFRWVVTDPALFRLVVVKTYVADKSASRMVIPSPMSSSFSVACHQPRLAFDGTGWSASTCS